MGFIKKMKLSSKIASIISIILIAIFTILILVNVISTQNAITKTIDSEFSTISKSNAQQIQQIIDAAEDTAESLQDYITSSYTSHEIGVDEKYYSSIYNTQISKTSSEIENYVIQIIRSAIKNNPNIVGMGFFCEPYKFDKNIKDYTMYMSINDIQTNNIQSYGKYEDYSNESYYSESAKTKKEYFTPPYEDQGFTMVTATYPIIYNNELIGIVTADVDVLTFSKVDSKNEQYPSMFATIIDENNTVIYDTEDKANIGMDLSEFFYFPDEFTELETQISKGVNFKSKITREDKNTNTIFLYPIKTANTNWWSITSLDTKDMNQVVTKTTITLLILSLIALIIIIITILITLKKMLSPINTLVNAAQEISNGNFDIDIKINSQDEIGDLTQSFNNMAHTLKFIIKDISEVLNNMSNKNLNTNTNVVYIGDLKQIQNSIQNILYNLNSVMKNINQSSTEVLEGSKQVSDASLSLAQGSTEQASVIEQLVASINEISEKVDKNAEHAQKANQISENTTYTVISGNKQMNEVIDAMENIKDNTNQIQSIIKSIQDISTQTNLLSLNASIEAARAGEAGSGFAVVANEIGKLAEASGEATKSTIDLVQKCILATQKGSITVNAAAQSLNQIVDGTTESKEAINSIMVASKEQSQTLKEIVKGIEQVSIVMQSNSAISQESSATSEELSSQAEILKNLVGSFKLN